jgi:hypothetical protein
LHQKAAINLDLIKIKWDQVLKKKIIAKWGKQLYTHEKKNWCIKWEKKKIWPLTIRLGWNNEHENWRGDSGEGQEEKNNSPWINNLSIIINLKKSQKIINNPPPPN